MNGLNLLRISAACLVLLCAMSARAEKSDREQKLKINADDSEVVEDKAGNRKLLVVTGNVVIIQGTIRIAADRVNLIEEDGGHRLGDASGNPVTFRQKRDDGNGYNDGSASRVEFDEKKSLIRFYNNVRFKMGANELAGEFVSYNSETEAYKASNALPGKSGPVKGQIEAVLDPPSRNADKDKKAAAKPEK